MSRVTMTHPEVDQQIEVEEVSVPHYQASGWQVTSRQDKTTTAAAKGRRRKGSEG
ncbi:hypothetical protein [Streptomyces sp. TRM68416]|uniref:hypothetical protein n=1 Tax=Streptomyces sp. TRM68416 TaxID=2758412 RepID=UPI001661C4E2|nr:hypothetical protein [Streptomyces sp. TRM68416]MBD0837370.1 hypothetical protein [Streptomyces sp. TRM68416]